MIKFAIGTEITLVVAEYLAKGYQLSDSILQRAIDIDSTLSGFDNHT